jgi:hypothetical protein
MKKLQKAFALFVLTAVFTCCDIGVRESSAGSYSTVSDPPSGGIYATTHSINGMDYRIFSMYNGGMCVVNVTKDKLELELLQLQIDSLKQ